MYAWKWWREHRGRVFTYLIALVGLAVLIPWMYKTGGRAHELGAVELWRLSLAGFGSLVMLVAGLSLGASGVGQEFSQGTLDFLLAQPRSRKYFVWAEWVTGASALLVMVGLAVVISLVNFAVLTKTLPTWKLLTIILPLFVFGAVAYSLTYFMTALSKSGSNGMARSLGLIVAAFVLPIAARREWHINLPSLATLLEASRWATMPGIHFPWAAMIGWSMVALAFPLATQFLFERTEV